MTQHVNWRSPCRTKSLPIRIRPDAVAVFSDGEQMLGNTRLLIFLSTFVFSWKRDELAVEFTLPLL
jgi:hypothetical protein